MSFSTYRIISYFLCKELTKTSKRPLSTTVPQRFFIDRKDSSHLIELQEYVGGNQLKPLRISKHIKKPVLGLQTGQSLDNFTTNYIGSMV